MIALLLLLIGCGATPFGNEPPRLISVNGVRNDLVNGVPQGRPELQATAGQDFRIEVKAHDPEGGHVRIWWPNAPAGWDFDPDATEGVWHVPDEPDAIDVLYVVLEDEHPRDPEANDFYVPVQVIGAVWDTGM